MAEMNIAVCSTFPNNMFDVYARAMLESYVNYMPKEIPLLVQLDDDLLYDQVNKMLPEHYGISVGWEKEHADFVERNKDKDDPQNYRKQPVRFCHKVFAIHRTLVAAQKAKAVGTESPRYLIWMDADVVITKPVTMDDIKKSLPKEGDAVAYLGRKDWEHSECGWLAFDLDSGGSHIIEMMYSDYVTDSMLEWEQQHDSWVFDQTIKLCKTKATNLTEGKSGMEIWPQSPMARWSIHYKGPVAKQNLVKPMVAQPMQPKNGQNFVIQTKNAIPHEEICNHIKENQRLIKNWIADCEENDETIAIVSAGPSLIAEDLRKETGKIVAVKHALTPLKKAGIKPWACILLDPRPHVADFVQDADPDIIWFIASQVNPEITQVLLDRGCEVWGYHASVGAGENELTKKQPRAVIHGGSATSTRGMFLLGHLGFRNFHLYGYELSFPDKPDLNARDNMGQPKNMEFSVSTNSPYLSLKKSFYSEPQLIAQYEEINEIIKHGKYRLKAFGEGMIPFILRLTEVINLRENELKCKMGGKLSSYKDLWNKTKKTRSLPAWRRISNKIHRKPMASNR